MVSPTARMAPTLTPADRQRVAVYGLDAAAIRREFLTHLKIRLAELPEHVDSGWEPYLSLALTMRDRLIERWVRTHEAYYSRDTGFRNRLSVLCDWTYSYLTYQRGERLITAGRRLAEAPGAVAAAEG